MITPMKKNGAVDFEGFRKHVKNQLKAGIDGLVPLCTTSETPTLDEDEEDKMLSIIMEERAAFARLFVQIKNLTSAKKQDYNFLRIQKES